MLATSLSRAKLAPSLPACRIPLVRNLNTSLVVLSDRRPTTFDRPASVVQGVSQASRSPHNNRERMPRRPRDQGDHSSGDSMRPPFSTVAQAARSEGKPPIALLSMAQLSTTQISNLLQTALAYKHLSKSHGPQALAKPLRSETIALIFSKRSTRTRVASESSIASLGGTPLFLGKDDIQLGVNESLKDTAKIVGSMTGGIMARVGDHSEIEQLAEHSGVPVVNALSNLYHPTQTLADLLTMYEFLTPTAEQTFLHKSIPTNRPDKSARNLAKEVDIFKHMQGKKVAWVGDMNNIVHDMLVSFPRLGIKMGVACPKGYDKVDDRVMAEIEKGGQKDSITFTNDPKEALKDADIVVTDTWISMGQEDEKAARLQAFSGYQVTEKLCADAGAKADWTFMHCLPRKQEEVDDEVFYGPRSVVFQEGENRKWTIMACFNRVFAERRL